MRINNFKVLRFAAVLLVIWMSGLVFRPSYVYAGTSTTPFSVQERLRLGERMYREGILPSGQPMQAFVKNDIPVSGSALTCVSCHLRSGLGSIEGGVVTPPTNGRVLFNPLDLKYKYTRVENTRIENKYYPVSLKRPAYNEETLDRAIRGGVDPSGREFNPVMPHYQLSQADMAILIDYLKTLSAEPPASVTKAGIHFATIVTEDVPADLRDAFLFSLGNVVKYKNNMADFYAKNKRSGRMVASMVYYSKVEYQKISLSQWILKGKPETWPAQLEEYYRKEPVFAILGGMSTYSWQPIHAFCEQKKLPALFPLTELPEISKTDWYTLYLSKGVYQEGESTARYLNTLESLDTRSIIQVVQDSPLGRRIAQGFDETWAELGHAKVKTIIIQKNQLLSKTVLQGVVNKYHPKTLLVWDDANAISAINALSSMRNKPKQVFVSYSVAGPQLSSIKDDVRDRLYVAYPFSLPKDEATKAFTFAPLTASRKFSGKAREIVQQVYSLANILSLALMDMRGDYYQDYFFDVIGMQADQQAPLYERLSFGPGQRYASKGCYIIQLGRGKQPEFIKKSDWVIY